MSKPLNELLLQRCLLLRSIKLGSQCRSDQLDQALGLVWLARQEWLGWSTLLGVGPASYTIIFHMSSSGREQPVYKPDQAVGRAWSGNLVERA